MTTVSQDWLENTRFYGGSTMNKMLSCEFIIDTGNVELRYADGSMISIDRTEVEAELAMSINARSKLD